MLYSDLKTITLTNTFYAWTIELILKQAQPIALKGFISAENLEISFKSMNDALAGAKKRMV